MWLHFWLYPIYEIKKELPLDMFSTLSTNKPSTAEAAKLLCEMTPSVAGVVLPPHVRRRVIAFYAERKFPSVIPPALTPTTLKGNVVTGDQKNQEEYEEEEETPYRLDLTPDEREFCGIF